MFDSYFASQTSMVKTAGRPLGFSTLAHIALILAVISTPYAVIKLVPAPALPVEIFQASAPPPPPPPPPPAKEENVVADELVEPEEIPKEIPEPVEEEPEPEPEPEPEEEIGQEGGVEGGFMSDLPAKMLTRPQRKISGKAPRFPKSAKTQGLKATIAARVCISASGSVKSVKILSGSPVFRSAVKQAVMTWRYEPKKVGNRAIPACFPAYFNFSLRG